MLLALLLVVAGLAGAIAPQTAAARKWLVYPDRLYVPAEGGVETVRISISEFDEEYGSPGGKLFFVKDVTAPAHWIRPLYPLPIGNKNVTEFSCEFFFYANTGGSREGTITFNTSDGKVKLKVIQAGGGKLEGVKFTLDPEELTVDELQHDVSFSLSCNLPFSIEGEHKVDKPDWVSVTPKDGFDNWMPRLSYPMSISIKPNHAGKTREGVIIFKTTAVDVKLKVTQAAAGAIKFTREPKELNVDANAGSANFTLSCNVPYHINDLDKPDWLSVSGNSVGYEAIQKMTIAVQPNPGPEREGVITFKTNKGDVVLIVTQAGTKPVFTLEPKELKVPAGGAWYKVYISCNQDFDIKEKETILPSWMNPFVQVAKINSYSYSCLFTTYVNTHGERSGEIVIKTTKGDVKLKVTQEAAAEPEAKFTLEPKELDVDANRNEVSFTLSCNVPYHINGFNKPDWLSFSGNSGGLEAIQKMTITVNDNTGGKREGVITFKTSEGNVTLKVTQAGGSTKPEPEKAVFTLEPKELKVETDGGKKEVKLSCNQAFELNKVTVPSWMERVPSSATSDEKSRVCAFNIQKNTGAERKGEIIFHTDKGDVTLKVTQEGTGTKPEPEKPKPTLTLSPNMLTFPTSGGKQTVNVKSDYGWDTKASAESASWMKLTTDVKTGTIVVEVTPNTSTKKRGATIEVVSSRRRIGSRNPITRRILVTQEAAKAVEPPVAATGISLNPAAMTMGGSGGTVGFNVYAGKGWTISGSPEWMHPDATRGSGTRLVIVRFDRNESGAERTGKLTVKSDDGKAERTFTLTQRAGQRKPTRPSDDGTYDYDLALNPEEITVGPSEGAGSSISVATSRLWAGSTTEDWIRLESAVGRGNGSFTFTVAPNPSKEMRHGTITVRTQQGMDELKVAIHQQGNDGTIVPPAEVKVSNVTLDPATITVNGDLSTALISAIVSPDNARNKGLLWMSSNASVATVQVFTPKQSAALPQLRFAPDADDYALVTIVGKGKAVITAAASDGSGIVARCEVNVLSTVANTVPYAPQAKVYTVGPTLYLSLPTPETVQVYTLAGTLYRTWQAPAGDTSLTLPAGTYIIKVGPLTEKVVVR